MKLQIRIGPATVVVLADCFPDDAARSNYVPFVSTSPACADVSLRIHTDEPPARSDGRLISELPRHWRLYSQDTGYRLEIMEQITFRPRQVVLLRRELDQGDVYLLPHPAMPQGGWFLAPLMTPLIQWWLAAWLAIRRQGLVLHASAVAVKGLGLAFVGESGAGKTTVARWCRSSAGAVLNDERIVISRSANGYNVSGTPWHGEWPEVAAQTAPLAGLFVLRKGQTNCFARRSPPQMVARIIPEAFLPIWSADAMTGLLETSEQLVREVPAGELQFVNDPSIAEYVVQFVSGSTALSHGMASEERGRVPFSPDAPEKGTRPLFSRARTR